MSPIPPAATPMGLCHGVAVECHDPLRTLDVIMRHVAPTRHELDIDVRKQSDEELNYMIDHNGRPQK
jgi:hypothetical protein